MRLVSFRILLILLIDDLNPVPLFHVLLWLNIGILRQFVVDVTFPLLLAVVMYRCESFVVYKNKTLVEQKGRVSPVVYLKVVNS